MEIYKDIIGYEGLYQVSNFGNVKSFVKRCFNSEKVLKSGTDKSGYKIVTLCENKKHHTKSVHRLMASAFYGESKLQVNHKDGKKANNVIENIEYVTASENRRHAIKNGLLIHNTVKIAEEKRKLIAQIDLISKQQIAIFESAHKASRETGINRGNICSCARGVKGQAGNYNWQYL